VVIGVITSAESSQLMAQLVQENQRSLIGLSAHFLLRTLP
jgi:hypothetical protein